MTALRTMPDFKVEVFPAAAIPRSTVHHYTIADQIHSLLTRARGDATSIAPAYTTTPPTPTPPTSTEYANLPNFVPGSVRDIEIISLTSRPQEGVEVVANQSKDGLTGFILKSRDFLMNSYMDGAAPATSSKTPEGNKFHDSLTWVPIQPPGTAGDWETVVPDHRPAHACIRHTTEMPDRVVLAQTKELLDANQWVRFDTTFLGLAQLQTQPGSYRLSFGNRAYSLHWWQNAVPTLERRTTGGTNPWQVWRRLEGAAATDFAVGTQLTVWVKRIAGHLVIIMRQGNTVQQWDVLETLTAKGSQEEQHIDASWPRGKLEVSSFGVGFTLGVGLVLNRKPHVRNKTTGAIISVGDPQDGQFEREMPWPDNTTASGEALTAGWKRANTKTTVAVTVANHKIHYTCTLKANPSCIDTPLVSKVWGRSASEYTYVPYPALDITPACLSASEQTAEPGVSAGPQWTLQIDRVLLDQLDANWQAYVGRYNPIRFAVRWLLSDGTEEPWIYRLKGHIHTDVRQSARVGERHLQLDLQDQTLRLRKPAALIDHKYYPLDFLFFGKTTAKLYVPDCVKEILSLALGDSVAATLNGNGDAMRFTDPNIYPLLSRSTDVGGVGSYFTTLNSAPTGNAWQIPAPFGEDAISWINRLSGIDFGSFFFGYLNTSGPTATPSTITSIENLDPVPLYGYYYTMVAGQAIWQPSDAIYMDGDENRMLFSAETGTMPEWDINRVLVWGQMPGDPGLNGLAPAFFTGEAKLPPSDPNAADYSWERTLLLQGAQFAWNGITQAAALDTLRQWQNKTIRRVRLSFRGEPRAQWGDIVQPVMQSASGGNISDRQLNLDGQQFRIIRLENSYDMTSNTDRAFVTTAACFPLNAQGQ